MKFTFYVICLVLVSFNLILLKIINKFFFLQYKKLLLLIKKKYCLTILDDYSGVYAY